jgi:hypothetical protein
MTILGENSMYELVLDITERRTAEFEVESSFGGPR